MTANRSRAHREALVARAALQRRLLQHDVSALGEALRGDGVRLAIDLASLLLARRSAPPAGPPGWVSLLLNWAWQGLTRPRGRSPE